MRNVPKYICLLNLHHWLTVVIWNELSNLWATIWVWYVLSAILTIVLSTTYVFTTSYSIGYLSCTDPPLKDCEGIVDVAKGALMSINKVWDPSHLFFLLFLFFLMPIYLSHFFLLTIPMLCGYNTTIWTW